MSVRRITATLLTAALGLTAVAAADDTPYTTINDVAVTVEAGNVQVTGSVDFGGIMEFAAFGDASGDAVLPQQGFDITNGTIIQDGKSLTFRMELADTVAGEVQPGALYNWNIGVSGAEEQRLFAWRNDPLNGNPGEWNYSIITFGETGFSTAGITGNFDGTAIEWYVDAAQIGASAGGKINAGDGPITASQGIGGFIQLTELVDYDTAMWDAGSFTIGGGVKMTLSNADEEFIAKSKTRKDVFTGTFTEVPAGTYTLEIISGFGDIESVETMTVTVA